MQKGQTQTVQVIESSTYRAANFDSIAKHSGVEKLCRTAADETGWILHNDGREETLVVSFGTPMFINEIQIEESLQSGHIVKLEMLETRQSKTKGESFSIVNRSIVQIGGGRCGNGVVRRPKRRRRRKLSSTRCFAVFISNRKRFE